MEQATDQAALVAALQDPACYPHPVERVETLETHISYVLLAGDYVYKLKKAVDLGFLDFRRLQARRYYCQEELRLNRRLAPELYLAVVALTGRPRAPALGGDGPPIEYAVKMRRFPQEQLFDRLLAARRLRPAHVDALAERTAAFHAGAAAAGAGDSYGTARAIETPAHDNYAQLRALAATPPAPRTLARLERWTVRQTQALGATFAARKRAGFVREGHGDFHLRNIALVDGAVTPFDCLEFDPNLRWIDVMNEVAFLLMDLSFRRHPDYARRFLNRYLEITGDYAGLRVLPFYTVYRAAVRAKIHWLRAHQPGLTDAEHGRLARQARVYLALARALSARTQPALLITCGVSGSGKTSATQSLIEATGAVRLRSDVERKRLQGVAALAPTGSALGQGAYTPEASARTYARLAALARTVLTAGFTAVVDAAFLARAQRDTFRRLAGELQVPFLILAFEAPEAELRRRVAARLRHGGDASEADLEVLAHQLRTRESPSADERALHITGTGRTELARAWQEVEKAVKVKREK